MSRTFARCGALFAATALFALPAFAATFSSVKDYTLPKGTTVGDDLYAAGTSALISGTVDGDLALAGRNVTIDGSVTKGLFAAGGTVSMIGHVFGNARIAGGNVTISGPIDGDLIVAGGTVTILPGATIGRDLVVLGGTVTIDGAIARNATLRCSDATINGPIGGTLDSEGASLTLGDQADIKGTLSYGADTELSRAPHASIAALVVKATSTSAAAEEALRPGVPPIFGVMFGLALFAKLLMFGTALIIFCIVWREFSLAVIAQARPTWRPLGLGFAAIIVTPIAGIALFATIAGILFGALTLLSYAFALFLAKIFAPIIVGAWLSKWVRGSYDVRWTWSLAALVLLELAALVPFIGWIFGAFVFLVSFGAIASLAYRRATR